uniref:Phorbol-ester/DAG-type domain-containing protein n=1 Tax=Davidia involucrata TaxID=16924 RepID=A0A5B7A8P0_DAVIN
MPRIKSSVTSAAGITKVLPVTKMIHASHPEHELKRKNYQKPYKCDGCKQRGSGWRYSCGLCKYNLHEDCMHTDRTTFHKCFKGRIFKFFVKRPTRKCNEPHCDNKCKTAYCDACGKVIKGFVYHCEKELLDLHPCCRNLKNELCHAGVKFRLHYKELSKSTKCLLCDRRKLRGSVSDIRGWSYVSECKNYNFHVYCATEMLLEGWKSRDLKLPLQVKSKRKGNDQYWRMVKIFLKAIVPILLGDPTITIPSLLFDLFSNS